MYVHSNDLPWKLNDSTPAMSPRSLMTSDTDPPAKVELGNMTSRMEDAYSDGYFMV